MENEKNKKQEYVSQEEAREFAKVLDAWVASAKYEGLESTYWNPYCDDDYEDEGED